MSDTTASKISCRSFAVIIFSFAFLTAYLQSYQQMNHLIKKPLLLIPAVIFSFFDFGNKKSLMMQKFILLYLLSLQFNTILDEFVTVDFLQANWNISIALLLMLPMAIAYLVMNKFRCPDGDILKSWYLLIFIILSHMSILYFLLSNFYGFGYENNFGTIAGVCFFFVTFLIGWQLLEINLIRKLIATVYAIYLPLIAIGF